MHPIPAKLSAGCLLLFLGACANELPPASMPVADWRGCQDEALALDRAALVNKDVAVYLQAASRIEGCLRQHADAPEEERLRAHALAVQDRLKGGDVAGARVAFQAMADAHPRADLAYPDGSSFRDTMSFLLGDIHPRSAAEIDGLRLPAALKDDAKRRRFWSRNRIAEVQP